MYEVVVNVKLVQALGNHRQQLNIRDFPPTDNVMNSKRRLKRVVKCKRTMSNGEVMEQDPVVSVKTMGNFRDTCTTPSHLKTFFL